MIKTLTAIFLLTFIIFTQQNALAEEKIKIITTIKPIHLMISPLVKDIGTSEFLLDTNANPHNYNFKPSEVKKIYTSDLFIYVSDNLEFFAKKIAKNTDSIELTSIKDLTILHNKDSHDDHYHHDETEIIDPHIWLNPGNSVVIINHISQYLIKKFPEHKERILENKKLASYYENDQLKSLQKETESIANKKFAVYHNSYKYLQEYFNFNITHSFTDSDHIKPTPRKIRNINLAIGDNKINCIIVSKEFENDVLKLLSNNKQIPISIADSFGQNASSYIDFIENMVKTFTDCNK